jgi:hypothetical protein
MLDELRQNLDVAMQGIKLKPRPTKPELFIRGMGSPQGTLAPARLEAGWVKKTPFMNRGLALVVVDAPGTLPQQVVGSHKDQIGEQLGYLPFLYPLALHMVIVGPGLDLNPAPLAHLCDKVNTFTTNLLTLHVADTVSRQVVQAKSWNAFFSGKVVAAVDGALHQAFQRSAHIQA